MKGLYLDVSTDVMYIGFVSDGVLVDSFTRTSKQDHAAYVIESIHTLLQRQHSRIEDIHYMVVGEGPGSYTGIRIAVTTAKTLAYAKQIALYSVSSLIFLSSGYTGTLFVSKDARRGNVFYTVYNHDTVYVYDTYKPLNEVLHAHTDTTYIALTHENYKVDISVIDLHKKRVYDIHTFEPNYTRITEAEEHAHTTRDKRGC